MINPSEKQTNKQTNLLKFLYMVIMQNLTEFILIAIPGPQVQVCTYVIWYVASVWYLGNKKFHDPPPPTQGKVFWGTKGKIDVFLTKSFSLPLSMVQKN